MSDYFTNHLKMCEALREFHKSPLEKPKRSIDDEVTPQFSKLYTFKNYFLELQMEMDDDDF